ncbi:MAG: hypothetical protein N0C84_00715 [Candidatus Thiodiazotropha taylori]|uniref:Uncharacterized protein n=1 Tax=Candidatus Thiodiazotropha taylori TaxID=2792791 RepID=A0A9E4K9E0_9GAMM|nr:hypothetical protein [Candidatus Thiodiazotropha taylori]MCW4254967.1 hypothetical protein [Candidatus Thiodiazotropha taylori]
MFGSAIIGFGLVILYALMMMYLEVVAGNTPAPKVKEIAGILVGSVVSGAAVIGIFVGIVTLLSNSAL